MKLAWRKREPVFRSVEDKFWQFVDKTQGQGPDGDCWGWNASYDDKGYGQIVSEGEHKRAHVISYEIHFGPVPEGLEVCHDCHNPPCTNPHHLLAGTHLENMRQAYWRKWQAREVSLNSVKPSTLIFVPEIERHIDNTTLRAVIDTALSKLSERQYTVIARRFGLDGNGEHTLEEIGEALDITRQRVQQIEAKALKRLRHPAISKELRNALAA